MSVQPVDVTPARDRETPPAPDAAKPQPTARRWPAVDELEQLMNPRRIERVDGVLAQRLGSIAVVFEDIFDPHNVGAGMRTCEGFGLQDVHVITTEDEYKMPVTITKSSDQWLTSHRHETTEACVSQLIEEGFEIWVADLEAEEPLHALPIDGKIAVVIGNETNGISPAIRAAAHRRYILPMAGMMQSYNLSVALAISLQHIVPKRREQLGGQGDLALERQWQLRKRWLEYGMRNAKQVRAAYAQPAKGEAND